MSRNNEKGPIQQLRVSVAFIEIYHDIRGCSNVLSFHAPEGLSKQGSDLRNLTNRNIHSELRLYNSAFANRRGVVI